MGSVRTAALVAAATVWQQCDQPSQALLLEVRCYSSREASVGGLILASSLPASSRAVPRPLCCAEAWAALALMAACAQKAAREQLQQVYGRPNGLEAEREA